MPRCIALLLFLFALSAPAMAAEAGSGLTTFGYDGCVDAAGKPVPARADSSLPRFAEARLEQDNSLAIYYNPQALPELLPETRLFLFAQECARFALKQPLQAERSEAQIAAADCWAFGVLNRSRGQKPAQNAEALKFDLPASDELWQRIGSPTREVKLDACPQRGARGNLALPGDGLRSDRWNLCVQACGAKLYACGRAASCQSSYNACSASCDGK